MKKPIFKGVNTAYAGVIVGFAVMAVSFQNCSNAKFAIDPAAKNQTLSSSAVLGNGNTGGNDGNIPANGNTGGNDGNVPVGSGNTGGNDGNIGTGNTGGNDGNVGTTKPKTGATPGSTTGGNDGNIGMGGINIPGWPLGGNDGNIGSGTTGGNDGNIGTGGTGGTGTTGGNDGNIGTGTNGGNDANIPVPGMSNGKSLTFELMCTFGDGTHAPKMVWDNSDDLKLIITPQTDATKVLCEVDNIRQQLINNQPVDISSCSGLSMGDQVFVVDMSVTSDYPDNSVSFTGSMYPDIPVQINYTTSSDSAHKASCQGDDPLLVQLHTEIPQTIALSAPKNGVMFDLLGQMIHPAHTPVLTSWFTSSNTENYFLVLPDANGNVLGIDQMFGNSTMGPDHMYATQGFAALAKYDSDNDGLITPADPVFSQLRLWKDANMDGVVQPDELYTLDEKGIVAIDLNFDPRYQEKDKYGNVVRYKSVVKMSDNTYSLIYDLWLKFIVK